MSNGNGFTAKFVSPLGESAVMIEDDGRVGYAYMLNPDGQICSDVWLYNRCPAPVEPEWLNPPTRPFANPASFVNQGPHVSLPGSAKEFTVEWHEADGLAVADILLPERNLARLKAGAKPGWSTLASKDGPLAQVWR